LLLLAALFVAWRWGVRRRSRLDYPTASWIDQRPRFRLPTPFKVHYFLRAAALIAGLVAIARPQEMFKKEKRTVEAVDIIISFDLSKSMEAVDFRPNRRSVALRTVAEFVDRRVDDRIGLVLFSGEAFLAVPLTNDHKVLKDALNRSSNEGLQDGTAIGQSLAVAVSHLRNSRAKSRIVILVTDGDNNMGSVDPETAAELAKGYGVKIYTIGMGKRGITQFPLTHTLPDGTPLTRWQQLTDAINDELLQGVATRTGGRFFRADEDGMLEQIFSTIDRLEKTKVESNTLVRYGELAWPWIVACALLLLLEGFALNTRWRKLP